MKTSLGNLLEVHCSEICRDYRLELVELDDASVALRGDQYGFLVTADRDGISFWYVGPSPSSESLVQIPLGFYLATRRVWQTVECRTESEAAVASYLETLRVSAKDILSGQPEWMSDDGVVGYPLRPELVEFWSATS